MHRVTLTTGDLVSTQTLFMLNKVTMVRTVAACYTSRRFCFIYTFSGASTLSLFENRRNCWAFVGDIAGCFRTVGPLWNQDDVIGFFLQHGFTAGGN